MGNDIKEMLDEEIRAEIGSLASMQSGTEEHSSAVDSLVKLYKLKLDDEKATMEHLDKVEMREREDNCKDEQLKESNKERYVKVGIAAAELVLPLVFYGVWMKRGFKFEENGTYTSSTFRGLFSRFRPTK